MEKNGKKQDGLAEKPRSDGSSSSDKFYLVFDIVFAFCFATFARIVVISLACYYGVKMLIFTAMDFILGSLSYPNAPKVERPSCLDDPSFGEHGVASINNTFIHYVASGKKGTAPLMIMLHGFAGSWYSWRNQIPAFNDSYFVVAIDMRGYGQSAKPTHVSDYRLNLLVEDVHGLIKWFGYKQAILVGHDWGALVAFQFTQKHKDEVTNVVAMSCGPTPTMADYLVGTKYAFSRCWYMFFYQLPYMPEIRMRMRVFMGLDVLTDEIGIHKEKETLSRDDLAVLKYNFSAPDAWTYALNYYRSIFSFCSIFTLTKEIRQERRKRNEAIIPTKALVCWGTADKILESSLLNKTMLICNNEGSRRMPVNDAPHWVHLWEPEKLNQKIKSFLAAKEDD